MKILFENYFNSVSSKFTHEETSEMGYRSDFEILLKGIFESIKVRRIDHDARAKEGNKPDFIVIKDEVPLLYIEAKNIGVSLDKVEASEQMTRYFGYTNLVLTDYVEFRFYRNGIRYGEPIKIANYNLKNRTLEPMPQNYEFVSKTLLDFTQSHKEPIRSGGHLSKIMGGKAQRIRDNVRQFLSTDPEKSTELLKVYGTFKELLVHDLTKESFSDMYAQTLVYGLFAARYHDKTEDNFSRQEARDLIPKSNPFLRDFFDHIIGPDFDKRLEYIVDELCVVFSHANVPELMEEYFKGEKHESLKKGPDPIIHFYEDFLEEYDPVLRKKMGAYYTPLPVVEFIVNSVDELLVKEFGLTRGLSDNSKNSDGTHRVQVLDPAVGTGTFISAVIGKVYREILKKGQKGSWPAYVQNDLLPRLHGFELMMTPYTIAHLKMSIAFKKTGFIYFNNKRLGIYLTNSLESNLGQMKLPTAFGLAESIAKESKEASKIKNDTPIMVVLGNPPYSVSSSNKGEWITKLIGVFKQDLNERNIQPLSDDYIKFIRFAEHFIEKKGSGIVAMITNNSFLDGIIHRQMRKHLLETFDNIYVLDLHGNSKKKEKSPDGSVDENVFDIQQGVSINIFLRKGRNKSGLGTVHHADLFGKRERKFDSLIKNNIQNINWEKLKYTDPYYFFVPKNLEQNNINDFSIENLFVENSISIVFGDKQKFLSFDETDLLKDKILVTPFDERCTTYGNELQRPRRNIMDNLYKKDNIALLVAKQSKNSLAFVHKEIVSKHSLTDATYTFPLCLFSKDGTMITNLNTEIVEKIKKITGNTSPEDIFDFIYAILYSPNYQEKYKEFLKIDFPRVPYPKDKETFNKLVKFGKELRELHLLESPKINEFITTFDILGSDIVEKVVYKDGNVWINNEQYFGNVPEIVWNFWIGGYKPVQKWLKDRKGRILTNGDIEHYQKMIVALVETDKVMKEIDAVQLM